MKQKRILAFMLTLMMVFTLMPSNIVFADSVSASYSAYGITIEDNVGLITCGNCKNNDGSKSSHFISKMELSPSGSPSDGKVTINIKVTMKNLNSHTKAGYPNPVTIPYTANISCDSEYTNTKVTVENTAGYKLSNYTVKKTKKSHSWSNGKCTTCGKTCSHSWSNGTCTTCKLNCSHTWSNGTCTTCKLNCSHSWSNGTCTTCGLVCSHSWSSTTGKCSVCGLGCNHSWSSGTCITCKTAHSGHTWTKDGCTVCGLKCNHSYSDNICTNCGYSTLSYIDYVWNDTTKKMNATTKNINDIPTVVGSNMKTWSDGWYVVRGNVTVKDRITVSGTVHLLLCDGATLTAREGITLKKENDLYIYAQSTDGSEIGKLTAITGFRFAAAIGGIGYGSPNGKITINGGIITANSVLNGVGSTGIGGGNKSVGGIVIINGGTVTAIGERYCAGIGGGHQYAGGTVTINGGNVKAIGGEGAEAIGKGFAGSNSGTLKNSAGNDVSLKTYTLDGITGQKRVSAITTSTGISYGSDFYTLDTNKIYLYLPSDCNVTSVTMTDGQVFKPKTDCDSTLYCTHTQTNGDYCTHCGAYLKTSEPTTIDGVYQLSSFEELVWFADYVKFGNTAANAVLTADINTLSAPNCKIGTSDNPYAGTFDGNGHKITVSLSGNTYTALFPYINGATIKNLNVDGTVTVSGQFASGLVGNSSGDAKLENCLSFVTINSSVSGDGTHGGLVAEAAGGSLTINNCGFLGAINGENTTNCGGLVGWAAVETKISNSYVTANFSINESSSSNTIARNTSKVKISNCYYVNSLGSDGTDAEYISEEQVKSGELAYKLNGSMGGGDKWYQNIDKGAKDNYPVPNSSHGLVYYGYADCNATTANFTNTYTKKSIQGHNGGTATCLKAGYCADCGAKYLEIDQNAHETDETYYRIINDSTHGKYHKCCNALIETGEHNDAVTEATCTGVAKCSICNSSYGGTDGTNHTDEHKWFDTGYGKHEHKYICCGLVTETEEHALTYTTDDDTISVRCTICADDSSDNWNSGHGTVTLVANNKVYDGKVFEAKYSATGFMSGWSRPAQITFEYCCTGGCKNAGEHTVKMHIGDETVEKTFKITQKPLTITKIRAFNKAYDMTNEVFVNGIDLDGIVIYKYGNYSAFDIKDSVEIDLSKAVVTVADSVPGYYAKAKIENITLSGSDKDNYSIAETAENVEITSGWGNYQIYKISMSVMPNDQTLYGKDDEIDQTAYTVEGLDDIYTLSGEFLYEDTTLGKIYVDTSKIKITYNDTDVTEYFDIADYFTGNVVRYCENHYFDEDGFCATGECDSYEEAILITKENCEDYGFKEYEIDEYSPKYAIYNAGQLYWFADRVNNYNENELYGVLANDITVNEDLTAENLREWIPIACNDYNYYNGNFYGNGHTVSGLYCKLTDKNAGFFGNLGYYSVTDLHIANSYFEGKNAGGISGYSDATITKCSVSDDVTIKGTVNVGGIIGSGSGTVESCYSLANVSGGAWGGLVGYNSAAIENCYTNAMQPVSVNISSYGGSLTNVYYAEDTRDYTTPDEDGQVPVKPTFDGATEVKDFASGEVAYLLQSGVKGEIIGNDENNNWEPIYGEAPQVWGQKIGTDKYPTFSNAKVYEDTYNGVNAYRNEIDGNKILLLGTDKKSATVVLDKAGTYTIVFADYEAMRLANLKTFEVTVDKGQAVRVTSDKDFTLGTGDKIMLWDNFVNLTPMCEAYEVK